MASVVSTADAYTFSSIDYPGARITEAWGINDSGSIVGLYINATGEHGFLYQAGMFTSIDYPISYILWLARAKKNKPIPALSFFTDWGSPTIVVLSPRAPIGEPSRGSPVTLMRDGSPSATGVVGRPSSPPPLAYY